MILRPVRIHDEVLIGYSFICPGCEDGDLRIGQHWYRTELAGSLPTTPVWGFNGSLDEPTFTPSLLNTWNEGPEKTPKTCHLFVTDGRIVYGGDCTHAFVGKTIAMVPFEGNG